MIQELTTASELLSFALDRYLDACLTIQRNYLGGGFAAVPLELSSRIISETQLMTTLELKLQKAKSAIFWSRNCSPSLVPIHTLPQELLARIFLFVSKSQYNCNHRSGSNLSIRPEALSYVCSRWRQLVINLPHFWSVIRLLLGRGPNEINRATAFAERAGLLRLDLQLHNQDISSPSTSTGLVEIAGFIAIISSRIRSFHLVGNDFRGNSTLPICLINGCKQGALKVLITSIGKIRLGMPNMYGFFDITTQLPQYLRSNGYPIRTSVVDYNMGSIDTLRLEGVYPFWTSKAYHGLVELRLGSALSARVPISESHLVGILGASPALRIFEFDLEIIEAFLTNVSISLNYLQSLAVGQIACEKLGTLVRWLFLSSHHLQLSLRDHPTRPRLPASLMNDEVTSFFSRSNVREIHAESFAASSIVKLIGMCPDLQTLALDSCDLYHLLEQPSYHIWHPRLESIFALSCVVDQKPAFSNITSSPALQNLLFWKCDYDGHGDPDSFGELDNNNLGEMAGLCPNVRVIDYNPIQGWNVFNE